MVIGLTILLVIVGVVAAFALISAAEAEKEAEGLRREVQHAYASASNTHDMLEIDHQNEVKRLEEEITRLQDEVDGLSSRLKDCGFHKDNLIKVNNNLGARNVHLEVGLAKARKALEEIYPPRQEDADGS